MKVYELVLIEDDGNGDIKETTLNIFRNQPTVDDFRKNVIRWYAKLAETILDNNADLPCLVVQETEIVEN